MSSQKLVDEIIRLVKQRISAQKTKELPKVTRTFKHSVNHILALKKKEKETRTKYDLARTNLKKNLPEGFDFDDDSYYNSKGNKIYVKDSYSMVIDKVTDKLLIKFEELQALRKKDEANKVKEKIIKLWQLGK